jgi:chromosome segregation ATPase
MSKKMTAPTLLHADVERWIAEHPTDPELERRRGELEAATSRVSQLRAELATTTAQRGKADEKLLTADATTRRELIAAWAHLDQELLVLGRQIERAEADRIRAYLAVLSRVDAVIRAEVAEINTRAAEIMPVLRGIRTPEGAEQARPLWEERERMRQRGERLESMQRLIKNLSHRVGEDVDVANPRTWHAAVAKAAARAMRVAA